MPNHPRLGGAHTEDKLRRLHGYLSGYTQALKNKNFVLTYIDAFAGSGDRTIALAAAPLFGGDAANESEITVPGSARMALSVDPPFDLLVFIEKHAQRHAALERIRAENPDRFIKCHRGDANVAVRDICRYTPWRGKDAPGAGIRAVMFLDPFGMEIEWETLQAAASTEAIDLWCLFSLSGLYRQAARDSRKLDEKKRAAISRLLGTDAWENEWYQTGGQGNLQFGDQANRLYRSADVDGIEAYVHRRLKSIFAAVLPPRRIYNSRGSPAFSLFFAVSSRVPAAIRTASGIATHMLKAGNSSHICPR